MSNATTTGTIHAAVAILDAGAQYGKVIDRRVRNLGFRTEILPLDTPSEYLQAYDVLIISGGPQSVNSKDAPAYDAAIFKLQKPILGICYGMQLMNHELGGDVGTGKRREDGPATVRVEKDSPLFSGLDEFQAVLMSHGDSVTELAPGFRVTAYSGNIVAAIENAELKLYGVQFHPEVDITENGNDMLSNFLSGIAGLEADYTVEDRQAEAIAHIREKVGDQHVMSFASGGVDSTVNTALLGLALNADQISAVHIDTGLMRKNESKLVKEALSKVGIELTVIDASEWFATATTNIDRQQTPPLNRATDPEVKRRIIGDTFMHVLNDVVNQLGLDPKRTILAQGTLRPDLIESASKLASQSGNASVIKTHHNDTPLVRELRDAGRVVEPLKELHKDEVRELGEGLGLPDELVWRQPFPGPGLGIRVICADEPYKTKRFGDINESLTHFNSDEIGATLLPIKTVGVQGDGRSYSYLAGLSGKADWPELMRLAREIPKQVHDVNRVVYVFGDRLESQVDNITPTHLTLDVLDQLREADDVVNQVLFKYNLIRKLSQVPVISFPVPFGEPGKRSIGIRTFITNDFMTGVPATPGREIPIKALDDMVKRVLAIPGIARVVYDLTSKPPGTTEWE